MPDYSQKRPTQLPPDELIIGNTWRLDFRLVSRDDTTGALTPFDLTGVVGTAAIRLEAGGRVLATPTVTLTDAEDGWVAAEVAAADTEDLAPGEAFVGVQLVWPDGGPEYDVVEGRITVRRGFV